MASFWGVDDQAMMIVATLAQWGRNAKLCLNISTMIIFLVVTVFDAFEYDF